MKTGVLERDGRRVEYIIHKRSKKNIIIRLDEEGRLKVSVPKRLSYLAAERLLLKNFDSLWGKTQERKAESVKQRERETFKYLGKDLRKDSKKDPEKFLSEESVRVIGEVLEVWTRKTGFRPERVRVRHLKSAWGICYSNKTITFNSKLIQLEKRIIEYVVVHELCHLMHMDHSADFWSVVERHLPDYRERRCELKSIEKTKNYFI